MSEQDQISRLRFEISGKLLSLTRDETASEYFALTGLIADLVTRTKDAALASMRKPGPCGHGKWATEEYKGILDSGKFCILCDRKRTIATLKDEVVALKAKFEKSRKADWEWAAEVSGLKDENVRLRQELEATKVFGETIEQLRMEIVTIRSNRDQWRQEV